MGMARSHFSVIFNGSKLGEFKPTRGIGQSDPISTYHFLLIAADFLCLAPQRYQGGSIALAVNLLLFVVESQLFFKGSSEEGEELPSLLGIYCES
jgi:hypothetical protein